jgi:nitroreductase
MSNSIDFSARTSLAGVADQFVTRWSPRAFDGSEISHEQQMRLFEAARWAPSCYNDQPWRFYTSTKNTFPQFLHILVEANQAWAKNAGLIGFLAAKKQFAHNGKDNASAEFDCGAAWMSLALQCRVENLYAHGMAGFDHKAAQAYLDLDETQEKVVMAFAVGRLADLNTLSDEQRAKEKPNSRKSLSDIWISRG